MFVDTGSLDLQEADEGEVARVNQALFQAMSDVCNSPVKRQALLKVHVGEPRCITRMKPEFAGAATWFLRRAGASSVVAGDTTVAYSGRRGHKENPIGNADTYLQLAKEQGWAHDAIAGLPFVALDRPCTALQGAFEFDHQEHRMWVRGVERFEDFYLAGGFAAADFVVNYAHLTLHGLAGVAGCVKSIAMGCSSLRGKLRMHQSLLPHFDTERCGTCGRCVESCPEQALELPVGDPCPLLNPDNCIGCGECEAVCAPGRNAVVLRDQEITDWDRGRLTLPERMADYTVGMMSGRWERVLHVLHVYAVTERCDCLDLEQDPITATDLGFVVGMNPFAVDACAARLLERVLKEEKREDAQSALANAEEIARYVKGTYGIETVTNVETVLVF